MTTTTNILQEFITDLKNRGGIEACAIVSRDGLLMSSDMPDGIMGETFAAMSATMLGAAETTTTELNKGLPSRITVESQNGKLICMGAGSKALLVVMAKPDTGLGLILVEVEKTAAKIKELM
ncbi:MAG: roadblock/LC7 domain-containing protein [Methanosarcinales archaeon]|nr:roadblock/LC7 domain-containing protein [Methanosarcinales archaeon]